MADEAKEGSPLPPEENSGQETQQAAETQEEEHPASQDDKEQPPVESDAPTKVEDTAEETVAGDIVVEDDVTVTEKEPAQDEAVAADHADDEPQDAPQDSGQEKEAEEQLQADQVVKEDAASAVEEQKEATKSPSPPPQIIDHIEVAQPPTEHMAMGTDDTKEPQPDVDPHAASPVMQYDKDAQATVKFLLVPSGQVATMRCLLSQTIADLKEHFAQELKIPPGVILLTCDGKPTYDGYSLAELGVGPNGTVQLEMQSSDPLNTPIRQFKPRQEYHMPDVITVKVGSEVEGFKEVVVEIERTTKKKPFLGGFRHKKTSVEYHHAMCQTVQKPPPMPSVERFCRDTQTVQQRNIVQQTTNSMSTQMTKIGVHVSNLTDKIVTPGKYTTADEFKLNIMSKIVVIQKYYRRWLAKRYVEKVRIDKQNRQEWERLEEIRKKKEKEDRIKHEFERRMNPKSKDDFDLLFHALEKWRDEEKTRIDESLTGAERKAALCQLLEQETQLISSIGRHKIEADTESHQKQIQSFLNKAAAPKKWKGRDGKVTEMDTPYTIRAQELKDIYNSINMKYLTQDERLDVLLTLKHTVKEHDCKLTHEIIELIDREADLLMRGVKESNLDGLRKRISTLYLQYIKTPTFNPEAARLIKVPQDPSTLRKNIYFCPSCNQYLPSTEFQLSSNSRAVGKCRRCSKIDNDGRVRQDYSHYRYMLGTLRAAEKEYGDSSKIAFLLQENDLRHLVENVWNSQSIVSAWEDLYDLVLVRWDRHQEWSPWNCILITKEEATAHEKLESLNEAYGKVFVHKIKHKHTLARNYFSRLPGMAEYLRDKDMAEQEANNNVGISGKGLSIAPTRA